MFDSDSTNLIIDDGASACITNDKKDFVGKMHHIHQRTKGLAGHTHATCKGTVRWRIKDDHQKIHMIFIPNTYFKEQVPNEILSLQHFAQASNDHSPIPKVQDQLQTV